MSALQSLLNEKLKRLYQTFPDAYAEDVLKVKWTEQQQEAALNLVEHRTVAIRASHSVGKSMLAGGLTNWAFDCFEPSITLTTAPTAAQVEDILWKEIRRQRRGRPGLLPKAPRLEYSPEHFAAGYTARDADSFQGRHEEHGGLIFDEAVGIDGQFFDAGEGMVVGPGWFWLCIYNPTDTASRMYQEEASGRFKVMQMSCLDHPNIKAELDGKMPPFPAAVRLDWLQERIRRWCTPIDSGDRKATDIEFPPGSGEWYRPGPLFEGRVLGRWPTLGINSVWSDGLWTACLDQQPLRESPTVLGCDVARFGDDDTCIHARRGNCSIHHEAHNGWATNETAGRMKQLCRELAQQGEDPRSITCCIDDSGVGGGVVDNADGFNFVGVNSSEIASDEDLYPNVRSELWFNTKERADENRLDVSRLDEYSRNSLRAQLMAPTWKMNAHGQRVVEPKEDTKKRLKRSPDNADAFNLAYYTPRTLRQDFM